MGFSLAAIPGSLVVALWGHVWWPAVPIAPRSKHNHADEEFLTPLGISQSEFAKRIGVSFVRLNAIVNGRRGVTPNTALRLERATGMDAEFWLGLQSDWDLWHELRSPEAKAIADIERIDAAADQINAEMAEVLEFQAPWPDDAQGADHHEAR